jgi:DNA-binding CsgD family transcriptional regulator
MVNKQANNDIICDVLRRVTEALAKNQQALDADTAKRIEAEALAMWGSPAEQKGVRNSRIHRAYLTGKRLDEIARIEGVTTRRVLQIIKPSRKTQGHR